MKPAYTSSLCYVRANEVIPPTLMHKLLSENRSAIGFCVRTEKGLDIEKFDEVGKSTVDENFKIFNGIVNNTKKYDRLFCFHSFPEKFESAEVQPYAIIKDSKGNAIVVVSAEGDFIGYGVDGLHSEAYGVLHDYLGPKIEAMYELLGNDPGKLDKYLRSKTFKDDLGKVYGHRAVFEFMPANGEPYTHGKNEIGLEAGWGRSSNVYGYSESVIAAAAPAEPEPVAARAISKYADAEPAPAPAVKPAAAPTAPAPATPTIPQNNPPTADPIAAAAAKTVTGHKEKIPTNLHGKRKKQFIRGLLNGDLPKNWEGLTEIWVEHTASVDSLEELPKLGVTANGAKDMRAAEPTPVKTTADGAVPVISGQQQAAAIEFFGKFLDSSSNQIQNPLDAQKDEARYPVFSELMKAKLPNGLDDLEGMPVTALLSFLKQHPETMWLAVLEYRRDRINRKLSAVAGDKKLSELTGTQVPTKPTTAAASPSASTPSTVNTEEKRLMSKYG